MKFRNLFFAAAAFAGLFSACSNEMDNAIENSGNSDGTAEAYASFSFSTPAGAGTRAGDDGIKGSPEENNITTVHFLLYKQDGTLAQKADRARADFTPVSENGTDVYTLKKESNIKIDAAGNYKVHIVVNPATTLSEANIGTLTALEAYTEAVAAKTGAYCTNNKFMMTNANSFVAANITKENNSANPCMITIPVERISAKYTFTNTENNTHTIAGLGTVTFDAYKVINTRNSAYKLRRVGTNETSSFTIGAPEAIGSYVVENFFDEKADGYNATLFNNNYSRKMNTYVAFRSLNTTAGMQSIAYSMENTAKEVENPAKGYLTGVILRGKATIDDDKIAGDKPVKSDGTFYKYKGAYYHTLAAIDATSPASDLLGYNDYAEEKDGKKETKDEYMTRISNNKAHLHNYLGIDLYAKGYCYYYYWIRHNDDNNKDAAGPMEYAIVRNNVYQLAVKSVSGLGSFESGTPGPEEPSSPTVGQPDVDTNPDGTEIYNPEIPGTIAPDQEPTAPVIPVKPEDPIFDKDLYLNVEITVNKWTIRSNDMEL